MSAGPTPEDKPAGYASPPLEVRAEILKLARLLGRDPAQLQYLARVPAGELRLFRQQVIDMLFTAHSHTLRRLAAASRILPIALIALLAERVFGPVLAARMAGELEPHQAVQVAARLSTGFLAELALHIDPRRATEVIAQIPPEQAAAITRELVGRGDYVTLASFVGHVPDPAILAALELIDDDVVLQIAFVLEHKDRLDRLIELLPEGRLDGVIEAAAGARFWLEALMLLAQLDRALQARLVERFLELDPGYRALIAERAEAAGVIDQLGPLGDALRDR